MAKSDTELYDMYMAKSDTELWYRANSDSALYDIGHRHITELNKSIYLVKCFILVIQILKVGLFHENKFLTSLLKLFSLEYQISYATLTRKTLWFNTNFLRHVDSLWKQDDKKPFLAGDPKPDLFPTLYLQILPNFCRWKDKIFTKFWDQHL